MSRAAFEKWQQKRFPLNEDDLNSDFIENALHEAWLAGRESMRDEAAALCMHVEADENHLVCIDYDTAASLSGEIRKIKP